MAFDSVAWFVEGGRHSANVARNVAFAAFQGKQGIVGSKDMEVRELAVPGTAVRVFPGSCAIKNFFIDGEMYAGRVSTETQVDIAATGPSGRSDMLVARVVNPYVESFPVSGWPALDPDPELGPFFAPYIISGVPASATTIFDTDEPNMSAIPLARIDMPPNTATVNQAYITDLRRMSGDTRERDLAVVPITYNQTNTNQDTGEIWPPEAQVEIEVPEWATHVSGQGVVMGCIVGWWGSPPPINVGADYHLELTDGTTILSGGVSLMNFEASNDVETTTLACSMKEVKIPEALRGKTLTGRIWSWRHPLSASSLTAVAGISAVSLDFEFTRKPETNL